MWDELRADLSFYQLLRYPSSRSFLVKALVAASSPGWWRLELHRCVHALAVRRGATDGGRLAVAYKLAGLALLPLELLLNIVTKSPIEGCCTIEGRVYLSDRGGIVLGCTRIGSGTLIQHDVTFGMNQLRSKALPQIGRNVWVGHDSVIYGPILVGDGVTILPGTVLSTCVPADAVVAGNPGRIVMRGFDNSGVRAGLADPVVPIPGATTSAGVTSSDHRMADEALNAR